MSPHDHQHTHNHGAHSHGASHDFADANKAHFTEEHAEVYEDHPGVKEVSKKISDGILKLYPFDNTKTTVMNFACGTGFADRELSPYTKSVLGVDISQGMVNQYNKLAESQGFSNKIKAVCGELKGEDGELDGAKFDVVLCTMAYHHFESINDLTKILAFFLKPGGSLMVADKERPSEKTAETVVHAEDTSVEKTAEKHIGHAHGFTEEDIKSAFEGAGLKSVSHEHVASATPLKGNGNYPDVGIFLAQAVKPAAQAVDHSACPCGKTHPA